MAANSRSVVLLIVGIVVVLVSLLADAVGIGAHPDLGWKQIVGIAVGLVLAVAGGLRLRAKQSS
jgi:hypothetical protein